VARTLDGSVVAVVGASGGLGRPICAQLEARGATVVRASRSSDVAIDLRDATAGDHLVEAALARHGRLDGVVNAAGIVAFGNLVDTDDVVIEELFLTNVLGPLWLAKRVAPALAETKGFLVNVSAVVAETPLPGMAAYSASKAALAAAAVALRRELRRMGVHVVDVRPPHTETGLADHPLAGTAPKLPTGLAPEAVAARIVAAVEAGDDDVPSAAFG
jgi:cyclic-di-GMP-binding biofilm dispersal mediator protein